MKVLKCIVLVICGLVFLVNLGLLFHAMLIKDVYHTVTGFVTTLLSGFGFAGISAFWET